VRRVRLPAFLSFVLGVLLPLAWLVMSCVTVAWKRRVYVGQYDGPEVVLTQYGFPLAYMMDYPYSSAALHWFLGPLLLNLAFHLLLLTLLAWALWPRLAVIHDRPQVWATWLLALPSLALSGLGAGLGRVTLTSPYTVLAELGAALHLGSGLW